MEILNAVNAHGLAAAGAGWVLGLACANIPLLVRLFVTWKPVSALIRRNPATAEAIVSELQKDVDEVAATPAPAAPPASPAKP